MNAAKDSQEKPGSPTILPNVREAMEEALKRIPPLWPLSRFVAVNPFAGLSDMNFQKAASLLQRSIGTTLAMPPAYYRQHYYSGEISNDDLKKAIQESHSGDDTLHAGLIDALEKQSWADIPSTSLLIPSDRLDQLHGTRWASFVCEEISKWCTAYFDKGQALWSFPWKGMPLFSAWREAASLDHNPEILGISGWRSLVRGLPSDPKQVIEEAARKLNLSPDAASETFYALLLGIGGWAGHLSFLKHEKGLQGKREDSLVDLLAIRLAYELALQSAFRDKLLQTMQPAAGFREARTVRAELIWQRAHECAMQRRLFAKLADHPTRERCNHSLTREDLPSFQAVFCIDVRSEILRRCLEKVAPEGQTMGFAGFFGFPIEVIQPGESTGAPQCPVLLTPACSVQLHPTKERLLTPSFRKKVTSAWKSFKSSAVSSFVFVEITGLGFLPRIIRDLLHRPKTASGSCSASTLDLSRIPLESQVAMAAGALRHLGLSRKNLSRIVLICGHRSRTENNPYGSSLDCGACGGHSGEANARTAATILNSPAVRQALAAQGIVIPEETWFVAGLHNTTTDMVTLYEKESAPASHQQEIGALERYLLEAGVQARKERSPLLGLDPLDPELDRKIMDRSRDWSEVRPEWGLAGNFAFIAAPRDRTRGINLEGRVFLNDYRHAEDREEVTLELLLSAPVVVGSWINLQYFASTVDNRRFGSGDKTIHNVAGMIGVYEGNGGDIRTGLPFQSVNDGKEWRHEPLRLHVCVEAPKESIDRVMKKHPSVANLVANHWIHLFSMSENGWSFEKSDGRGGWTKEFPES